MLYPPLLHPINWSRKDVMLQSWEEQGHENCPFWELVISLRALLPPHFHFPRQILFSLLAQELGCALAESRIVRQPIERIPP
jgi:hypothetical protein